jgi:endonuclease/exonuclease/phosphatase family metal-dependent hydrolase
VQTSNSDVKVASYNIHLAIGRDGSFQPFRIAEVIEQMGADTVALQEVSLGNPGFDMLQYLSKYCGMTGIAGPTLMTRGGRYGNGILTRRKITKTRLWNLSVHRCEPRGAIETWLDCNGRPLRVIATHFGLWPAERRRQARRLVTILESGEGVPTVLLGDVNEWFLWGRPLRLMRRHFGHTPAPATFPSGHPVVALDRIFVEPRNVLRRIAVHASGAARIASDHLPVTATLDLSIVCDSGALEQASRGRQRRAG